jgi:hypothetical protein
MHQKFLAAGGRFRHRGPPVLIPEEHLPATPVSPCSPRSWRGPRFLTTIADMGGIHPYGNAEIMDQVAPAFTDGSPRTFYTYDHSLEPVPSLRHRGLTRCALQGITVWLESLLHTRTINHAAARHATRKRLAKNNAFPRPCYWAGGPRLAHAS